ncbi:hypothetical protein [Pilimelia columellifera]|uniref:Uncharacterized protein n=1 Tax=Pilimelia columellifera subsp. columellifera TaxID=706583 RepID=A0ABP6ADU4_9ACTN
MRHMRSLLAATLVAPLIWLLVGYGQTWSASALRQWEDVEIYRTAELLPALGCLAGAALLVAGLLPRRVSPAGPATAALLLAVPVTALMIDPFATMSALTRTSVLGRDLPLAAPVGNGTLPLLVTLLLFATALPARWRRPAPAPAPPSRPVTGRDPEATGAWAARWRDRTARTDAGGPGAGRPTLGARLAASLNAGDHPPASLNEPPGRARDRQAEPAPPPAPYERIDDVTRAYDLNNDASDPQPAAATPGDRRAGPVRRHSLNRAPANRLPRPRSSTEDRFFGDDADR